MRNVLGGLLVCIVGRHALRSGCAGSSSRPTCVKCGPSPRRRATTAPTSARRASWLWPSRTSSSPSRELDQGNYFRPASTSAWPTRTRAPRSSCRRRQVRRAARQPGDSDGDGILDQVDKCPDEPEDKDGFEDEDGCPDPDNDKDGIPDTADKCPNEPEDKDGFEDEDGCPDPDNDTDGLPDKTDKCPNEPEDKDGFEDDGRLPRSGQRQGRRPRPARQVPERAGRRRQRRLPEEVRAHRRHPGEDRAQAEDLLRHQQGDHPAAQLRPPRRGRQVLRSRPR